MSTRLPYRFKPNEIPPKSMAGERPITIFAEPFRVPELPPPTMPTFEPAGPAPLVRGRDVSNAFAAVRSYFQKNATEKLEHKKLRPRYYFTDPKLQSQNTASKTVHGDVLLQRIRYYLANMPVTRSEDQKHFHEEFLRAVAPGFSCSFGLKIIGLYGPQFEVEYKRILRQNGWASVRPQAMVKKSPRELIFTGHHTSSVGKNVLHCHVRGCVPSGSSKRRPMYFLHIRSRFPNVFGIGIHLNLV